LKFAWAGHESEKPELMAAAIRSLNNKEIGDLKKESFDEDLKQTIIEAFDKAGRTHRDLKSITEGNGNGGTIAVLKTIFDPGLNKYNADIESRRGSSEFVKIIKEAVKDEIKSTPVQAPSSRPSRGVGRGGNV
jgi:hypothetical protein